MVPSAQELEPKAALQQIGLPMNADKRAAGLATLSQLVWTADSSRLGQPRADYMRCVRDQLTAAEQVWAPNSAHSVQQSHTVSTRPSWNVVNPGKLFCNVTCTRLDSTLHTCVMVTVVKVPIPLPREHPWRR